MTKGDSMKGVRLIASTPREILKVNKDERISFCLDEIAKGTKYGDIVKKVMEKYDLKMCAAKKYIAKANEQLRQGTPEELNKVRSTLQLRFELLYQKAVESGEYATANSILKEIKNMYNLDGIIKNQGMVIHADLDYSKLSDTELRNLKGLIEKSKTSNE